MTSSHEEAASLRQARTLTTKAMENYESRKEDFQRKLDRTKAIILEHISEHQDFNNVSAINDIENEIRFQLTHYNHLYGEFCDFLTHTKTEESEHVKHEQSVALDYIVKTADRFLEKLNSINAQAKYKHSKPSVTSAHSPSVRSSSSRLSERILMTQAKVQAAKARLKFSEQELTIKKQRALLLEQETVSAANTARRRIDLEIDLQMLQEKKELAAVKAEAETYELSLDGVESLKSIPKIDPEKRTAEFVKSLSQAEDVSFDYSLDQDLNVNDQSQEQILTSAPPDFKDTQTALNAKATEFYPKQPRETPTECSITSDFMRFLLKKDLLLSRLTNFNDRPEHYLIWKTSFKSIMIELNVTPFEELDLLVKWLGPESLKQAVAIRAAYATRPDRGLACIWERLEDRFGAPEMVDQALRNKLNSFPVLEMKERKRLYDLADIVSEIEAVKEDEQYSQLLGYYDTSSGVSSIVNKLPYSLKEKWISRASRYKQTHHVAFPPFGVFANFLREISKIRNDPGLCYDNVDVFKKGGAKGVNIQQSVSARKTGVTQQAEGLQDKKCPLHGTNHSLNDCRSFKSKRFDDRKKFVRDNGFCFKCCESSDHKSRDCKSLQRCADCGSDRHPTALHFSQPDSHKSAVSPQAPHSHGGEHRTSHDFVANKCTQICGPDFLGKSCAKMVLVKVYHETQPSRSVKAYAIIDDQSNRSLARSALFDILELECSEVEYSLSSCGGHVVTSGRVANGCVIESLDGAGQFDIPTLLECDDIPNVREEIPTPNVAVHHPHLSGIAHEIPPLDEEAEILLLIGRDLIDVHHVHDQRIGRRNTPYAQKLGLGWVIIGETCLDNIHRSNYVNVKKTYLLQDGRTSVFNPCENSFKILEKTDISNSHNMNMYSNVFEQTPDDDKPGLSIDDKEFLAIMKNGFVKDDTGFWKAPLPFRSDRQKLPNNRACAERRGLILDKNLRKDTVKKDLFLAFMDNMFKNGHAEKAPDLQPGQQCWYLPVFGVFHPHKPNQIRCVFDSSAKYNGVSLNDVLLTGPDFTNNLAGILLRFRKEKFAIMADIQQMFYSFYVLDGHRDYLRFLWYEDNDFDKSMIEYRMCVHVFGNSPSPAIATYGLRKTVQGYEADR